MTAFRCCIAAAVAAVILAGCAAPPLGPTVQVIPGPDKPFGAFQDDQALCRNFAGSLVAGQAEAVNRAAVGGTVVSTVLGAGLGALVGGGRGAAIGAATGAGIGAGLNSGAAAGGQFGIQVRYNQAYVQCMLSRGNQLPGYGPVIGYAPAYQAPAYQAPANYDGNADLVRAVQAELNRLLYMKGAIDGVAGPQTVAAIDNFERANGLPVDGAPSAFLLDRLRRTQSGY